MLAPGQAHTLQQSGWVTVTAQHGGAVCVVGQANRASPWQALAAACAAVLGRYRSAKPV
jgi:hypothetical protein